MHLFLGHSDCSKRFLYNDDISFFVCAVATAGRYGYISLAPYVIGYALFRAYIMRMVTLWTYLDEFFIRRSYRHTFVPTRVQNRKP
jgi:hypothetical protein